MLRGIMLCPNVSYSEEVEGVIYDRMCVRSTVAKIVDTNATHSPSGKYNRFVKELLGIRSPT